MGKFKEIMYLHKTIFTALIDLPKNTVPVFIPTFNQPSLLQLTLNQLNSYREPIIIVDNNSTSDSMNEFLENISNGFTVVKLSKNIGPRLFTEDSQILSLMPDHFIVTDPDLIYNKDLPDNYIDEMKKIITRFDLAKVGFALDIHSDEEVSKFQDAKVIQQIEESYWSDPIGKTSTNDIIYRAWIDTTFSLNSRDACLYHRKFNKPTFRYPSARIGGKYTCQHTGWWKKELMPQPEDEIKFYLQNQKWSHTENYHYK